MHDHGSELTPEELDHLEDALAVLGEPEARGELDALSPRSRERFDAYAAIVALAREAMPLEDVPPGVLDGILAEARRTEATPAPPRERGPGLWERLRRSFALPGLALAGTAALLLWAIQPVDERLTPPGASEAAPSPAALRAEDGEGSPGQTQSVPTQTAPKAMIEAPAESADEAVEAADLKDSQTAAQAPAAEGAGYELPAPGSAPRPTRAKAKKADAEAPPPLPGLDVREEARVDADKETVRDQLDAGDRARHRGDCGAAAREYTEVARSTGPAAERARALVGLGLCREAAGDPSAAERYFDEARALDPAVATWLRGEHERELKRAAKPKAAGKASADGL